MISNKWIFLIFGIVAMLAAVLQGRIEVFIYGAICLLISSAEAYCETHK